MIASQTFHLQCRGTQMADTHVEHINYAYAALASLTACQSQFICCFSCLRAANAMRSDATPLHSTRLSGIFSAGHSSFFMALTLSLVSANKHKQQQQRWQVYFLWPRLPLSFSLPLSLFTTLTRRPFCPFLCWLRAVKFISFNINWQHENLFINCSFSLLYPVRELSERVAWCVQKNKRRE